MKKYFFIVLSILLLSSCIFTNKTDPSIEFLMENAVDTLEIDDASYILDAFVYRDYFPGDSQELSLRSIITLFRLDSLQIPSNISMIEQYVMWDDSLWVPDSIDQIDISLPPFKLKMASIGGPEWPIGSYVDVISKIRIGDIDHYLIKRHVEIIMTQ